MIFADGEADKSWQSGGSSSSMQPPRRPCCSFCCKCCCRCNVHSVIADHDELQELLMAMKHLTLRKDIVIGGELFRKDCHLLRVGRRWQRRGPWEQDADTESRCKDLIEEFIEEEKSVKLVFAFPRIPMPWYFVLKWPCCVCFLTVAAVVVLCVVGISGSLAIETNTDSFLDSDSQSSTYFNAYLKAIKGKSDESSRRLRAIESFSNASWPSFQSWRTSYELASLRVRERWDSIRRWNPFKSDHDLLYEDRSGKLHPFQPDIDTLHEDDLRNSSERRLRALPLYRPYKITLIYRLGKMANEGTISGEDSTSGTILTGGALSEIRKVEEGLRSMPEYVKLCTEGSKKHKTFCDPGFSVVNFLYPTAEKDGTKTTLKFNGSGSSPLPIDVALSYIERKDLLSTLFPSDRTELDELDVGDSQCGDLDANCASYGQDQCRPFAKHETYMHDFCASFCNTCGPSRAYSVEEVTSPKSVVVLRSSFHFLAYCCMSNENTRKGITDLKKLWDTFVSKFVDMMQNAGGNIRVFYSGDGVETYEAQSAVNSDLLWAIGSYAFVMFYATLHTRSLFLAIVGLFLVMLSIPSALSIFALCSGSETVSLMSCLSIFIVIGIGSDMLFVYTDFWKQSVQYSRDRTERLKFTYKQAASSTAATTFTTAMSFLANLASVLRPLREFGFFMGACVIMAWVIMFFAYPPVLVVNERCSRRLGKLFGQKKKEEDAEESFASSAPTSTAPPSRRTFASIRSRSSQAFKQMLDPEKTGVGDIHKNFLGGSFSNCLHSYRCTVVLFFIMFTVGCGVLSVLFMEQASGVPQIFPDDHNQVLGKKYAAKFQPLNEEEIVETDMSGVECNSLFDSCTHFKCETTGRTLGSPYTCPCFVYDQTGVCQNPDETVVHLRVLARKGLQLASLQQANVTGLMKEQFPDAAEIVYPNSLVSAHDIIVNNWDTGSNMMGTVLKPASVRVRHRLYSWAGKCEQFQICYCATSSCSSHSSVGAVVKSLQLHNTSSRRMADVTQASFDPLFRRRLQEQKVTEGGADVSLVFGMEVTGETPLLGVSTKRPYEFLASFNLQDPWAQRKMEQLCTGLTNVTALKIGMVRCWLLGFRDYWKKQNKDWPVRPNEDMNSAVHTYANDKLTDGFPTTGFIWFEGKKVVATYVMCFLTVSANSDSTAALKIKEAWDDYFQEFNAQAQASIKGAWHASKLWVRAEAEKVIIDSTLVTLAISLGCVFLGIFVFTHSAHLAFMVMVAVLAIIVCLLFFMTCIMQWEIGAIEVLCLIVFVGFAVDYCLHVAHKYHSCHISQVQEEPEPARRSGRRKTGVARRGVSMRISDAAMSVDMEKSSKSRASQKRALLAKNRPEERFQRTRYSLERMGGAVVGSGLTTIGCAAFLLPCQLAIFTKIGGVVVAVTVSAIIFSMVPLPAVLMLCGPCGSDFQTLKNFIHEAMTHIVNGFSEPPQSETKEGEDKRKECRIYVLHMPARAVSAVGLSMPPTRTRVIATG